MTAKEMFEALGFKQTTNNDTLIEYIDVTHEDDNYIYIIFYLTSKEYEVGYSNIYQIQTEEIVLVTIKEHEAITKQMKELGWIVELLKEGNNDL